ncbi:regulator of chromosome condensation 1/beta-lactamase-inhibitor protein II, partial [Fimicolochytrium jonesii]|uniref:regulator of chromosome condensation 1/beta-lactamase-inhibitor protein II n=1 Tax=Fimicolochytrium jonesii TaxID=1396493 RepID=UPI0022FE2AE6
CIDVASTFTTAASITASGTIRTWRHGSPSLQTIIAPSIAQFPYTTISAGLHHFLATTSNGDVYSWGANGLHGQLGGGFRETTERKAPIVIEALQGVKVLGVSAGDTHSAVVSGDGDVYTFGSASHGELGLAENPDVKPGDDADELNHALPTPIDLELPPGRVMVACGSRHTVISDGTRLFGCGWNKYDQLNAVGSDLKKESCGLIPIELRHLAKPPMDQFTIQAVSCGSWHTVVL